VQEVQQIVGILPGGIETNDEVNRAVVLDDMLQALSQLGVTTGRLGERQLGCGRLQVVAQESSVVRIA
jgi:hypothetical protein